MAKNPKPDSGLRTKLTRRRIIEVSPLGKIYTSNDPEEIKAYWAQYPFPETNEKLFIDAEKALVEWYVEESLEIGERRAFWGLVYRLLDHPTNDDSAWIQNWLYQHLRVREDFQFPCWMEDLWD